jgi:hypothetical protein
VFSVESNTASAFYQSPWLYLKTKVLVEVTISTLRVRMFLKQKTAKSIKRLFLRRLSSGCSTSSEEEYVSVCRLRPIGDLELFLVGLVLVLSCSIIFCGCSCNNELGEGWLRIIRGLVCVLL